MTERLTLFFKKIRNTHRWLKQNVFTLPWASLVAQSVKNLPAILETWV